MKIFITSFLFLTCNAEKCTSWAICKKACECGSNVETDNCQDNSLCKDVTQSVTNALFDFSKLLVKQWQTADGDKLICVKTEASEQGHINTCEATDKCDITTGKCVKENTVVDYNTFSHSTRVNCLIKNTSMEECTNKQLCDESHGCLDVAEDDAWVDGNPVVCVSNEDLATNTAENNYNIRFLGVQRNICNVNERCKDGTCQKKCNEGVICNEGDPCICNFNKNETDCNSASQYCEDPKAGGDITAIEVNKIKFLTHGEIGDGDKYCATGGGLNETHRTVATICDNVTRVCDVTATEVTELCKLASRQVTNLFQANNAFVDCYYNGGDTPGIATCNIDASFTNNNEWCYENGTKENACLSNAELFKQIQLDGDEQIIEQINQLSIKINLVSTKIDEKCGGENSGENSGENAKAPSDGVSKIAIGALTVGVINLILIGSVLVLLLCFNNNKGGKPAKEAA